MNDLKTIAVLILTIFVLKLSAQSDVTVKELREHLNALASDEYEGRKPGTDGDSLACKYISDHFESYGLKVEKQAFEVVTGIELGNKNLFKFNNETFSPERDYIPLGFSENASLTAKVSFVGYGIISKNDSLNWNDYSIDVKNQWVIILTGKPHFYKELFHNKDGLRNKVLTASDQGAKGVIFVHSGKKDELSELRFDKSRERSSIPVLQITQELFEEITQQSVTEYTTKINQTKVSEPILLQQEISATCEVNFITKETFNLIASIKGSHPISPKSYIVVGAHYDHLGYGGNHSGSRMPDTNAVHNGADDNASGVGAVLELAEYFSKNQPQQNFKFIAFGAEEMGLLGSKFYAEDFVKKGNKAIAMLNFDMLGRLNDDGIIVGGTGTASEFDAIISSLRESSFKVTKNEDGFGPSDHASFYVQNFPVLYISTGAHSDYHTPFDDVERINFPGYKSVVDWSLNLAKAIDNRQSLLSFQETQSSSQKRHAASYKVTFGIIPDFASKDNMGLKVDGTRKGGPAESGGMKKGDIITAVNGKKVSNIYDYMSRLGELDEGDTVTVDILRGEEKKILLIQL